MNSCANTAHMLAALDAAKNRQGMTFPNPAVGALVVEEGIVIATGYHLEPGAPHAEVIALSDCRDYSNCDLYVTLEPCCHHGRTPPCTDLIISKGVKRVFFAYLDPNPKVAGQGQAQLRRAGIPCEHFPLSEITAFYRSYAHWSRHGMPRVTAKLAMTQNRMIACDDGAPFAITSEEANALTHQQRSSHCAILSTVNTIIADNPQFNVRLNQQIIEKDVIIIDRDLRFPADARVLQSSKRVTLLHASDDNDQKKHLESQGFYLIDVPLVESHLCLRTALRKLAQVGIHDLWLECGGKALKAFFEQGLIDEFWLYVSDQIKTPGLPLIFKSLATSPSVSHFSIHDVGQDTLFKLQF